MTMTDVTSAKDGKLLDAAELSTEVEEAACLLKSYCQLANEAAQFQCADAEQSEQAQAHIYALLTAMQQQIERLGKVPEALMALSRHDLATPGAAL